MKRLTDRVPPLSPRRARAALAASLFILLAAGSLTAALAIEVKPKAARADLAPLAGTWIGYLPGDDGARQPAVELTVAPTGRVELTMIRLQHTPEGSTLSTRMSLPASEVSAVEDARLTFRTRAESFSFQDWPPGPAETTWTLQLQPDGRAVLTSTENSYFAAAKARGQSVPPPPPPTVLERQ